MRKLLKEYKPIVVLLSFLIIMYNCTPNFRVAIPNDPVEIGISAIEYLSFSFSDNLLYFSLLLIDSSIYLLHFHNKKIDNFEEKDKYLQKYMVIKDIPYNPLTLKTV